jgi:hypothetical protein
MHATAHMAPSKDDKHPIEDTHPVANMALKTTLPISTAKYCVAEYAHNIADHIGPYMDAAPAYYARKYMQDSAQRMPTSLAVQDRKKSTSLGKTYEAQFCYGNTCVLQVKLPRPPCYSRYNSLQKGKITYLKGKFKN